MKLQLSGLKNSLGDRIDLLVKVAFGVAIAIGCYFVVAPFGTAILVAAMLCVVTWPFFLRVDRLTGNRRTASAVLMAPMCAPIFRPKC